MRLQVKPVAWKGKEKELQKVLRKRILRDLKENLFRYLALGLLIFLCMFLIVALLGSAETLIRGTEAYTKEYKLEDGQFTVFVPLSETELKELEETGIEVEEQFFLDYRMEDGSTLRIFKNREQVNLVKEEIGVKAEADSEVVIEKRYSECHNLTVGAEVEIGGKSFQIAGIGCSPDYDSPLKNFSDSTVDSNSFGIAFVTKEAYESLRNEGMSVKAEEYLYVYRIKNTEQSAEEINKAVKNKLQDFKIQAADIEDEYFQEYWKEQTKDKEDLEEGIHELFEGACEVRDGAGELADALEEVQAATAGIPMLSEGMQKITEGAGELADGSSELAEGVEELRVETDKWMEQYFDIEISNLVQLVTAENNSRIGASIADQQINKYGGLIAGVILIILFAYVISVFVVYGIEKESSTIGALYALGVKKSELVLHYLYLPVVITFLAGVIGFLLGISGFGGNFLMGDCYAYYSIPVAEQVYPPYLIIYSVVMPPLLAALVNAVVIGRKLNRPALQMIRNEQKQSKISNVNLGKLGFIARFRIRQMLRELRTSATVVVGMFIALLILMLGVNCYVMCQHISVDYKADTKYEYMYTYKYPEKEVPEGGYEAVARTMKKENLGYNLDVTVLGITQENPFFDMELTDSKQEIVISSAMAEKYGLRSGEQFVLTDDENDMNYAFSIKEIYPFSTGFYVFMDIESARELFGEEEDFYNVVFSDKELEVDAGRLYAITTREDIVKASDVFINMLMPMVKMMTGCAALIFVVVMYLMLKVMIDRSAFHISMVKVFGYRMKEIKKLYINGNFYVIAVGAAITIPLAKLCMNKMYPLMVSNVGCSMNLTFSWQLYALIYVGVLALYFLINLLLVRRLKKVDLAEVLKNRE